MISNNIAGQEIVICVICEQTFTGKNGKFMLKRHIKSLHEGSRDFKCKLCDKTFAENNPLFKHVRRVHEKLRPFQCDICKNTFALKSDLNRHARFSQCRR